MSADIKWLISVSFFVPALSLVVSQGDADVYRSVQIGWVALLFISIFAARRFAKEQILSLTLLLAMIWIPTAFAGLRFALTGDLPIHAADMTRLAAFSVVLIAVAQHRWTSLDAFLAPGRAPAIAFIAATLLYLLLTSQNIFLRHTFFGLHPNWGGELLFSALIFVVTSANMKLRVLCFSAVAIACFLLQSRAAIVASGVLFALTELYWLRVSNSPARYGALVVIILALFGVLVSVLFGQSGPELAANFIREKILLLNDAYRGAGTNLVGRGTSFTEVWNYFYSHPVIGVGAGNATQNAAPGEVIHIGHLAMLAEYGLFSLIFYYLLTIRLIESLRTNLALFAILVASTIIFFFNARSINLNLMPLLMWIFLLEWPAQRNDRRPRSATD